MSKILIQTNTGKETAWRSESDRYCEAVFDIAYLMGAGRFHSGDSRQDFQTACQWAEEFEAARLVDADQNETYFGENYLMAVETFAAKKLAELGCVFEPVEVIVAVEGGVVQAIYCNNHNTKARTVDCDGDDERAERNTHEWDRIAKDPKYKDIS